MTIRNISNYLFCGHRVILLVILCLFGLCTVWSVQPEKKRQTPPKRQQAAGRQGRAGKTGKVAAARYEDNRVYLLNSDKLYYDKYRRPDFNKPAAQVLVGNVKFLHQGATLYCDSAHFYEASNSFEAFNNVKMLQGDTLSLVSDYAYYDGNEQMCRARFNVVLKNRESTLYTDSLNFDRLYGIGYFFEGGKLVDNGSVLTSDWGEYNTGTKIALFNYSVKLRGENYVLTSDTLYYDMNTSTAHVLGPSDVVSGTSRVYTEDGYYNTKSEKSELFGRSVVRDGGRIIIGDSVYYDKLNGTSEAFGNVVYTDTVNRNKLTGDYCFYNDQTGYGMATKRAVAMDFSQGDTLYMHADTFKIYTFNINTDSVYRKMHAYNRVRAFRTDVQAVCDSLVFDSKDSCLTMYRDPIAWNLNQQLLGEVIKVYMRDSTIDRAHVIGQALSVEQMPDSVHFNQVASREMFAFFKNGEIYEADADDNVQIVYYPIDESDSMLIGLNYTETSKLKMFLENRKMKRIWMPKAEGTLYPMSQIPPDKKFLPTYAWFDYVRPLDKDDIFNWRGKKAGTELKEEKRRDAPLRRFGNGGETVASEGGDKPSAGEPEIADKTETADEPKVADGNIH